MLSLRFGSGSACVGCVCVCVGVGVPVESGVDGVGGVDVELWAAPMVAC